MAKNAATVVLYLGVLYLAYLTMKSWGIIGPMGSLNNNNWKPLTENELRQLNIKRI